VGSEKPKVCGDGMNLHQALKSSDRKTQDDAFASLKDLVYPIAHRRLNYSFPQWVDDAVMEAMGKIFDQVDEIKSEEKLLIISKRVAMNCAVSLWRKQMTEKRGENKVGSTDQLREERGDSYLTSDQAPKGHVEELFAAPLAPVGDATHLDNLDTEAIQNITETMMTELNTQHRLALSDVLEGLSYKEISQKRGWPMGTVAGYVKRGKDAMRKQRLKYTQLTKEAMQFIVKMLL
jgi:RNA polymerase sigma factor (sigma-70 family)